MKITIFRMDNHYSVKFATALYEQSYKLVMGENIQNANDVREWVSLDFIEGVAAIFSRMHGQALERHKKSLSQGEEDVFEEII